MRLRNWDMRGWSGSVMIGMRGVGGRLRGWDLGLRACIGSIWLLRGGGEIRLGLVVWMGSGAGGMLGKGRWGLRRRWRGGWMRGILMERGGRKRNWRRLGRESEDWSETFRYPWPRL